MQTERNSFWWRLEQSASSHFRSTCPSLASLRLWLLAIWLVLAIVYGFAVSAREFLLASVLDNQQHSVIDAMTRVNLAVQVYPFTLGPRILQSDLRKALREANK